MFKKGLDVNVHISLLDTNGRFIILDVSLYDQRITLVSLYGHNSDQPDFFSDVKHNVLTFSNSSIVLCGDWNTVQDYNLDTYNVLYNTNPNSKKK